MTLRLNPFTAAPALMKLWRDFSLDPVLKGGIEESLLELVKMRASQINACARCLHMHAADARRQGESEERLYLLDAWRESPIYTARERAALAWTEALTLLPQTHAPDDAWQDLCTHFSEPERVALTLQIVVINGWNRVQVGFRAVPAVEARHAA
jgi:AhpD family alkylhydroperoxidase